MRLTQFTDFALRALLHAAVSDKEWLTVAETARSFGGLSEDHLAKVVRELGRLDWLEVRRGRGGGFRLKKDPEEIVIGEVVRGTEPDFHLVECFDAAKNQCPVTPVCGLNGALAEAKDAFLAVLDGMTLANVLHNRRGDFSLILGAQSGPSTEV